MRKFVRCAISIAIISLVAVGCATVPKITKGASDYLQKGMASAKLRGNEFYMAIGEVDLYTYGVFGGLRPSGKTVEIATVIQADKDTGEVLRIATMQADKSGEGVAVENGAAHTLADLRGGISVIDVQPYPRWLDAIDAMRDAIVKLNTYTNFAISDDHEVAPVVAVVGFGWRWGRGWGWGGGRGPRFRHWR